MLIKAEVKIKIAAMICWKKAIFGARFGKTQTE